MNYHPLFNTAEAKDIKDWICEIGRRVYNKGFAAANDGNISYRVGENEVLCTPTMVSKGYLKPEDICKVDYEGKQLAESLTLQAAKYMQAVWSVKGEPKTDLIDAVERNKLDYELMQRWLRFLERTPRHYPFLKDWQAMMAKGGTAAEARGLMLWNQVPGWTWRGTPGAPLPGQPGQRAGAPRPSCYGTTAAQAARLPLSKPSAKSRPLSIVENWRSTRVQLPWWSFTAARKCFCQSGGRGPPRSRV